MLLIAITITFATNAQIPNNGFEDWSTFGNGMIPNGWWCSNDSINPTSSYFPITRSSDHYPTTNGNYSIRLECNPSLSNWAGFGMAWPGSYSGSDHASFPVIGHPKSLCGYYKYLPQNGDMMNIRWFLYKNGVPVLDGYGELLSDSVTEAWTPFRIYVVDTSYTSADSARILLSPFNWNGSIQGNSVLYVDNLSFDNPITAIQEQSSDNMSFSLYPNPTSSMVTVNISTRTFTNLTLNVYDIMGALVKTELLKKNQEQISISDLSNGIYVIEIRSPEWSIKNKLIVKK